MKKIVMILVLVFLISAMMFGAYLEVGANSFTPAIAWMMFYGPLLPTLPLPSSPVMVFPTQIAPLLEGICVLPVSGHFSLTADFEDYSDVRYNASFVSGTVGMRYTSNIMDPFLGPLRAFAGVNGGGLLQVGGTTLFPLVTADVGVFLN